MTYCAFSYAFSFPFPFEQLPAQRVSGGSKVAVHDFRSNQLQDGSVSSSATTVSSGIRLSTVPQQQRSPSQSKDVQISLHAMSQREARRRVGGANQLRERRPLRLLPYENGAAIPSGDLQVHKVQRHAAGEERRIVAWTA